MDFNIILNPFFTIAFNPTNLASNLPTRLQVSPNQGPASNFVATSSATRGNL
tara:strand:- start:21 stop:176 length:156 start_codon:yes stop_codon:yes gene_type:complete